MRPKLKALERLIGRTVPDEMWFNSSLSAVVRAQLWKDPSGQNQRQTATACKHSDASFPLDIHGADEYFQPVQNKLHGGLAMAREQTANMLEDELSHLPEGDGPQKELRDAYRELRAKSPTEERSAVFHDALMSVFKRHPQFRFSYDGKYFRHT